MTAAQAFLLRDIRVARSYKLTFLFGYVALVVSLFGTRFLADLVGSAEQLEPYGGDYFSFILLGTAFQLLAYPAVTSFRAAVRGAQVLGTLEPMLLTGTRISSLVLSGGAYALVSAVIQVVVVIFLVGLTLGAHFDLGHAPALALVLAMTLAAYAGMGLISAAFTIVYKQNEPITLALLSLSVLLSGVLYPTSVLPRWLEVFSPLIPMTHALELGRGLFVEGAGDSNLGLHFAALAGFALLLPAGLIALRVAVDRARRAGSLGQY